MPNAAALLADRAAGAPAPRDLSRRCVECCGASVVSRLRLCTELDSHTGCVNTVEYNADGSLLVTGSDDLSLKVWHGASFALLHTAAPGHTRNIFGAKFVPYSGDSEVVSCGLDGQVRHCSLVGGPSRLIAELESLCCKVAFSPACPRLVLFCSGDGTVRCHDLRARGTFCQILVDFAQSPGGRARAGLRARLRDHSVNSLAFSPTHDHVFAVGASDVYVRLYDIRYLATAQPTKPPEETCFLRITAPALLEPRRPNQTECSGISGLAFSSAGDEIVASYKGDDVYVFPLFPSKDAVNPVRMALGPVGGRFHSCTPRSSTDSAGPPALVPPATIRLTGRRNVQTLLKEACFLLNDQFVVSGGDSGHICVWEKRTGRLAKVLRGDQNIVNGICPHPTQPAFASCGIDNSAKVWGPRGDPVPLDPAAVETMDRENEGLRREDEDDLITNTQIRDYFATLLRSLRDARAGGDDAAGEATLAAFFGVEPTGAFPGAEGPDDEDGDDEEEEENEEEGEEETEDCDEEGEDTGLSTSPD